MTQPPLDAELPLGPYPPLESSALPRELQPIRALAITAAAMALVVTLMEVVEAVLASRAESAYFDRGENASDAWMAYNIALFPAIGALIASYIVTCLWLYRARKNIEILRPQVEHKRRIGWVWAGWLVPFVNLWFPFQVVHDIRVDPMAPSKGGNMVGWWWTLWLFTWMLERVASTVVGRESGQLGMVESLNAMLMAAALVPWLLLIRDITRDQERAIAQRVAQA